MSLRRFYNKCVGKNHKNIEADIDTFDTMPGINGRKGLEKIAFQNHQYTDKVIDIFKNRISNPDFTKQGQHDAVGSLIAIASRDPRVTRNVMDTLRKDAVSDDGTLSQSNFYYDISSIGRATKQLHSLKHNSGYPTTDNNYHEITKIVLDKLLEYAHEDGYPDDALKALNSIIEVKPAYFSQAKDMLKKCEMLPEKQSEYIESLERVAVKALHDFESHSPFDNHRLDPAFIGNDRVVELAAKTDFFQDHPLVVNYKESKTAPTVNLD